MTDYNDGKWHGWNGGECPVHPETLVTCMWQDMDGFFDGDTDKAKRFEWIDIDAFRVAKEHNEPREFWIHDGKAYDRKVSEFAMHVREVIE